MPSLWQRRRPSCSKLLSFSPIWQRGSAIMEWEGLRKYITCGSSVSERWGHVSWRWGCVSWRWGCVSKEVGTCLQEVGMCLQGGRAVSPRRWGCVSRPFGCNVHSRKMHSWAGASRPRALASPLGLIQSPTPSPFLGVLCNFCE